MTDVNARIGVCDGWQLIVLIVCVQKLLAFDNVVISLPVGGRACFVDSPTEARFFETARSAAQNCVIT